MFTIYAHKVPRVQRSHHPTSVIVGLWVSYRGPTEIPFCQGNPTGSPTRFSISLQERFHSQYFDFHQTEILPFFSPDLNPLDYRVWLSLYEKVFAKTTEI